MQFELNPRNTVFFVIASGATIFNPILGVCLAGVALYNAQIPPERVAQNRQAAQQLVVVNNRVATLTDKLRVVIEDNEKLRAVLLKIIPTIALAPVPYLALAFAPSSFFSPETISTMRFAAWRGFWQGLFASEEMSNNQSLLLNGYLLSIISYLITPYNQTNFNLFCLTIACLCISSVLCLFKERLPTHIEKLDALCHLWTQYFGDFPNLTTAMRRMVGPVAEFACRTTSELAIRFFATKYRVENSAENRQLVLN